MQTFRAIWCHSNRMGVVMHSIYRGCTFRAIWETLYVGDTWVSAEAWCEREFSGHVLYNCTCQETAASGFIVTYLIHLMVGSRRQI